ncbi:MAG: hypothetical protein D3923_18690, partial [Candidatus Electrothrix sp. AR3]|nr:hypothetical protein [Candidatus Electrothrix sp. AR3]
HLFPSCPPYYQQLDFSQLYQHAKPFEVEGMQAYTLADEEMLWHLYQHGLHAPLTYEPCKLISIADIIALVEDRLEHIDWERMSRLYPQLVRALPFLEDITPWNDAVRERLCIRTRPRASSQVVGDFMGWPKLKLGQQRGKGIWPILRDTFFPSRWWLKIYYTPTGYSSWLWCRLVKHPQHILWWFWLYWDIFLQANLPEQGNSSQKRAWFYKFKHLGLAMYRKIK